MSATTLILLLLVLACPLSMLFMHRGGGHSHGSHADSQPDAYDGRGEGDGAPGMPPRGAGEDAGTNSEGGGHAHDGRGHGGDSRHEHTKSGASA